MNKIEICDWCDKKIASYKANDDSKCACIDCIDIALEEYVDDEELIHKYFEEIKQ